MDINSFRYFLGVDPGKSGAIAVVNLEGELISVVRPRTRNLWGHKIFDPLALRVDLESCIEGDWKNTFGLMEEVNPYKQGKVSAFSFSANSLGIYLVLESLGITLQSITPAKWKPLLKIDSRSLSTSAKGDLEKKRLLKAAASAKAKSLFSDFEFASSASHDEEEAALLAWLAWNSWRKNE